MFINFDFSLRMRSRGCSCRAAVAVHATARGLSTKYTCAVNVTALPQQWAVPLVCMWAIKVYVLHFVLIYALAFNTAKGITTRYVLVLAAAVQ
jgi:hypothetical protein